MNRRKRACRAGIPVHKEKRKEKDRKGW